MPIPNEMSINLWPIISTVFPIIFAAGSFAIGAEILAKKIRERRKTEETLDERINRLTKSLTEATHLVGNIQSEIENRQSLVTKLQNDIDTYNELANLKKAEVEAVAQVLRGELVKENKKGFWQGVAVNFLFFVFGAVVTFYTAT